MEINVEGRLRTMRILWFALLLSIGSLFLLSRLVPPEVASGIAPSSLLIVALTAAGTFLVAISFVVKRKFLQRSVEKQDVGLVQQGLVIACAICEASALLGLLEHFVIGNREYFLLFLAAAAGTVLHFPRREHLLAASPRIPISGASS
jgi:hypothetical protein